MQCVLNQRMRFSSLKGTVRQIYHLSANFLSCLPNKWRLLFSFYTHKKTENGCCYHYETRYIRTKRCIFAQVVQSLQHKVNLQTSHLYLGKIKSNLQKVNKLS